MTTTTPDLLHGLAPISLDALVAQASLQTRVDRKYVLPLAHVDTLVAHLADDAHVLEIGTTRLFAYESVYFDTPDLLAYRLAATRRRRRFKVRTRSYLDSAQCWLEVKTRGTRGTTVKDRLPYESRDRLTVTPGRWFVTTVLARTGAHDPRATGTGPLRLRPVMVTRYRRTTLLLPGSASRLTIDTHLTLDDGRRRCVLDGVAIVETKTGSTASAADRTLWSLGHRPVRLSKYATGLAALRPDLAAHRWHRTLTRLAPHLRPDP